MYARDQWPRASATTRGLWGPPWHPERCASCWLVCTKESASFWLNNFTLDFSWLPVSKQIICQIHIMRFLFANMRNIKLPVIFFVAFCVDKLTGACWFQDRSPSMVAPWGVSTRGTWSVLRPKLTWVMSKFQKTSTTVSSRGRSWGKPPKRVMKFSKSKPP